MTRATVVPAESPSPWSDGRVNMSTSLAGLEMPSPVLTASGCAAAGRELDQFFDITRLGAVVTKSITLEPRAGRPTPRMAETPSGMLNSIGLQGPGITAFVERDLAWLTQRGARTVVSIAGDTVEDYAKLAKTLRMHDGVDAIEVNISCPNVAERGQVFACSPDSASAVIQAVRRNTDSRVPILAKLSPDVTDITSIAVACVRAGADGLSVINTLLGLVIDTEQMRPALAGVTGGLSGPAIRPVAVRCVWQIRQALPDIPILGMGGIRTGLDALQFIRVSELFGDHFLFDISKREGPCKRSLSTLCLRNVVPAAQIGPRMAAARSVTLFSATLSPRRYYADLLGMPADTAWLDVASPFAAEQLRVQVVSQISTRFQHRAASLAPIIELIGAQYAAQPGNYLAFFSSFEYLQQVATLLAATHPEIVQWSQAPGMDEAQRHAFLQRFQADGQGIGFAVLGGAFSEGVDLPGTRLIGAFVATLGLPQVNPVNEQIKQRMGLLFGAGFDYTYLYPGVQKVIQAAGRVIRGTSDRGMVMLIDDRFNEPRVQSMFPAWWAPEQK